MAFDHVTGINARKRCALFPPGIYHYKDGREFGDLQWTIYDYPKFQVVLHVATRTTSMSEPNARLLREKGNHVLFAAQGRLQLWGAGASLAFRPGAAVSNTREDLFPWVMA